MDENEEARLSRLETDMYFGSDRGPSVTARLQKVEGEIEGMGERLKEFGTAAKWFFGLMIATLLSVIGELLIHVLKL